ncbi:hypothetical protein [Phormidesmis priestleyi]
MPIRTWTTEYRVAELNRVLRKTLCVICEQFLEIVPSAAGHVVDVKEVAW